MRPLGLLIVFIVFSTRVAAQLLPTNTPNYPRHITLDQRTVAVFYPSFLTGSASASQYVVKVNGVSVPVTGVSNAEAGVFAATAVPTSNLIAVKFDATTAHAAATTYLLPGETVTVSFTNTGSTLIATTTSTAVGDFSDYTSKNTYTPGSDGSGDIAYQSEGIASVLDQCSPVNTNYFRWTYLYSLRFRNSTAWTRANNKLHVIWGNGASNSDLGGTCPIVVEIQALRKLR